MNGSVMLADVPVIDDQGPVRTSVAEIFLSADASVLEAADGHDALDLFESGSVGVIPLDIRMPRRTRRAVLRAQPVVPRLIFDEVEAAPGSSEYL